MSKEREPAGTSEEVDASALLAYALGTMGPAEAAAIEAALMSSQETLGMYLAIKRSLLPQEPTQTKPSARAKARLREAVAARYAPRWHQRLMAWLRRPIPLYQGLAAASVALGLAALAWFYWPVSQPNTSSPMIDTSSHGAEQLDWS